ncbi:hypothetical protein VNO77_00740 [Canavalia gladiata]|uniref:Uncharacterized protein n=1 Tax=Canavalia gladiata TaxID=3824 RepID=A0AAN9LRI8_CANGL
MHREFEGRSARLKLYLLAEQLPMVYILLFAELELVLLNLKLQTSGVILDLKVGHNCEIPSLNLSNYGSGFEFCGSGRVFHGCSISRFLSISSSLSKDQFKISLRHQSSSHCNSLFSCEIDHLRSGASSDAFLNLFRANLGEAECIPPFLLVLLILRSRASS